MATVHGIPHDADLHTLEDEQIQWLWSEITRNNDSEYIMKLQKGLLVSSDEHERQHIQVREEMRRRGLFSIR